MPTERNEVANPQKQEPQDPKDQRLTFLTINEDGTSEIRRSALTPRDFENAKRTTNPKLLTLVERARRNRGLE